MTRQQLALLRFVNAKLLAGEPSPSYDEMKNALGLKSKSGIFRIVQALIERGYVSHLRYRARSVELLKLPLTALAPQ